MLWRKIILFARRKGKREGSWPHEEKRRGVISTGGKNLLHRRGPFHGESTSTKRRIECARGVLLDSMRKPAQLSGPKKGTVLRRREGGFRP